MGITPIQYRRHQLQLATLVLAIIGASMLVVVVGVALMADVLTVHPPDRASGAPYQRPSAEHFLGTDDLGRDLWAQLVYGARVSVLVGVLSAVLATVIGTAAALIAGHRGGWVDFVIMRTVDLVLSLPFLVLVLVLATYFGRDLNLLILLIAGVLWARPARLLRGQVLKVREFGHVVAAESMGAGSSRILVRHVLLRMVPLLSSQFVRAAAVAVIVQSGVAFLGLGDPSQVSWGSILYFANNASAILTDAWLWWIVPPGVALAILIVGLAFVGFALEEWADPQIINHGARPTVRRRLDPDAPSPPDDSVALEIRNISVDFNGVPAVSNVNLMVRRGRLLGLVGESGSGKSTLAAAVIGLVPHPGKVSGDAIFVGPRNLRRIGRDDYRRVRSTELAIVPQVAMNSLDPTMSVLAQVTESAELSGDSRGASATARSCLTRVGIGADRHRAYPHELSGGQRQRVVIAMGIANRPKLLIADEPTTGLDVVTQREILDLIDDLRRDLGLDVVLISHDLEMMAARSDDLAIMHEGSLVETGPTATILADPRHPHTTELLAAFDIINAKETPLLPIVPVSASGTPLTPAIPGGTAYTQALPASTKNLPAVTQSLPAITQSLPVVLALEKVEVTYRARRQRPSAGNASALTGTSLRVTQGERVAIVGRSGAGKSTIARLAVGLVGPTRGTVQVLGNDLALLSRRELQGLRHRVQLVFQDPYDSLHPGMRIGDIVSEPAAIAGVNGSERRALAAEALSELDLVPIEHFWDRYPGSLSGGQRQRVAIARALVVHPEIILADEPASMLDASLRVTVASLLLRVQARIKATLIFITHDMTLARRVAERIVVVADGQVVEDAPTEHLISDPQHPETRALLNATRYNHATKNS